MYVRIRIHIMDSVVCLIMYYDWRRDLLYIEILIVK